MFERVCPGRCQRQATRVLAEWLVNPVSDDRFCEVSKVSSVHLWVGLVFLFFGGVGHAKELKGFARSGAFVLTKGGQVCPKPKIKETSVCREAKDDERTSQVVAGIPAAGTPFDAKFQSGRLVLFENGEEIAVLPAVVVGGKVKQIWLSPLKDMVAVEYEAPAGQRTISSVWVVGVKIKRNAVQTPPTRTSSGETPETTKEALSPGDEKRAAKLLKKAMRRLKARRWKEAKKVLEQHLSIKQTPQALFFMAKVFLKMGNEKGALEQLVTLSHDRSEEGAFWRVEARQAREFAPMRSNAEFRAAVGIDRSNGRELTAYERVVGFGGTWEQTGVSCEAPEVSLSLSRKPKQVFRMAIRTTCGGTTDTTRLSGKWQTQGGATLSLVFPNVSDDDDVLECKILSCESSSEDCVHCQPDPELNMVLRVVRR